MCQAVATLQLGSTGTAVDTWQGDVHMEREDGLFEEVSAYHDPKYSAFSTLLRATFDQARPYFSDGSIDVLHIDGTHTYEAVRHDFETWKSAMSDRGIVLFHDIEVRRDDFGVWKLWEELRAQYPSIGFKHSHGLGVISLGKSSLRRLQRFSN
ncbi:class I SAM-dependent methyltransferase [Ochrobactrum ciceri]|uniref:Class I SAM-dependent methyltransferase n=1 Tax=Brucella ciceri TaxID=391287 RepID=A0ABX1DV12_9HYPH|nr:class I SAM-dependent methyltransferase [Brucella ciceri]